MKDLIPIALLFMVLVVFPFIMSIPFWSRRAPQVGEHHGLEMEATNGRLTHIRQTRSFQEIE